MRIGGSPPTRGTTVMFSITSGPVHPRRIVPIRTSPCSSGTASAISREMRAGLESSHGRAAAPTTTAMASVASSMRT
jgi:hypothetical protein